jgi:hypothetical protein
MTSEQQQLEADAKTVGLAAGSTIKIVDERWAAVREADGRFVVLIDREALRDLASRRRKSSEPSRS